MLPHFSLSVCLSVCLCLSVQLKKKGFEVNSWYHKPLPVFPEYITAIITCCIMNQSDVRFHYVQVHSTYRLVLLLAFFFNIDRGRWGQQSLGTGEDRGNLVVVFVGFLTFQQYGNINQGRICVDDCTCCHVEKEYAGQTCRVSPSHGMLTLSRPVLAGTDPVTAGA